MGVARTLLLSAIAAASTPAVIASAQDVSQPTSARRSWMVEDSIRLRYYSCLPPSPLPFDAWMEHGCNAVAVSPNGRYFFILSHIGRVATDDNVYSLQLWDAETVAAALAEGAAAPMPLRTLEVRSDRANGSEESLRELRFDDDSRSVLFIRPDAKGIDNVHRLDIATGRITALTHHTRPVLNFDNAGSTIIFSTLKKESSTQPLTYPVHPVAIAHSVGAAKPMGEREILLGGRSYVTRQIGQYALSAGGHEVSLIGLDALIGVPVSAPGASPDGRLLVATESRVADKANYVLLDLRTGHREPLGQVSIMRTRSGGFASWPVALWSPDGSRLLISRAGGVGRNSVDIYEPATGRFTQVAEYSSFLSNPRWVSNDSIELSLTTNAVDAPWHMERLQFALSNGVWSRRPTPAGASRRRIDPRLTTAILGGLSVTFRQGLNQPPVLVATKGERSLELTRPDPLLAQLWWAKADPIEWTGPDGKQYEGGLRLPRGFQPGSRLPLVIQAYYYDKVTFLPDGTHRGSSDAAQLLVANGFAVLQIDLVEPALKERGSDYETWRQDFLDRVDSAVSALAAQGTIDPARVGLTGFSIGGYFARYAITHPGNHPFAAVVAADPSENTFVSYVLAGLGVGEYNRQPFWKDKQGWLAQADDFNIDRVRTPVLMTFHGIDDRDMDWKGLAARAELNLYDMNGKPADALLFPNADHELLRPKTAIAEQQAVLDWMSFWLKGLVPADPERAQRWLLLRKAQEKVLADLTAKGQPTASLPPLLAAHR